MNYLIRATKHGTGITHARCHKTSYNPNDVEQRYCGYCHVFLDVERLDAFLHLTESRLMEIRDESERRMDGNDRSDNVTSE